MELLRFNQHVPNVPVVSGQHDSGAASENVLQRVECPHHAEEFKLARFRAASRSHAEIVVLGLRCRDRPREVGDGMDFVAHPLEAECAQAVLRGIREHLYLLAEVNKIQLLFSLYDVLQLSSEAFEVRDFGRCESFEVVPSADGFVEGMNFLREGRNETTMKIQRPNTAAHILQGLRDCHVDDALYKSGTWSDSRAGDMYA